jgi:hypothetical protein
MQIPVQWHWHQANVGLLTGNVMLEKEHESAINR